MSKILKKLFKIIYVILESIYKLIDKLIIMPISRLVYNITKVSKSKNVDLNKYLPSSKKQEIAANKIQFENEKNKILREQEIEIQEWKEIGAYVEIGNIEFSRYSIFGELAKEYALNLINKYMK